MDIKTFAKEHFEEYQALICKLTSIPAPSHHEERRAAFICVRRYAILPRRP